MINQRASIFMGNNWEIYHKDSLNVYYCYEYSGPISATHSGRISASDSGAISATL